MTAEPLVAIVTTDLSAVTRGRSVAARRLDEIATTGVGWLQANLSLTPFSTIVHPNPWGSRGDLRLLPDMKARFRTSATGSATPFDMVAGDLTELDGTPWIGCTRGMLKSALTELKELTGLTMVAAFEQEFGFFMGSTGGSYIPLFPVVGEGYGVTGEAVLPLLTNQLLRWGRNGDNGIFSSKITDNTDNRDHMVTYQIFENNKTSGNGAAVFRWLVLWEDIRENEPFEDFDFNDLVVEITAVPEPASVASLGLVALLGLRRRRA